MTDQPLTQTILNEAQQIALVRDGFVVIPAVVPNERIKAARALIYRNLGRLRRQIHTTNAQVTTSTDATPIANLGGITNAVERELAAQFDPIMLGLLNESPLAAMLSYAFASPLPPARGCQLATNFPHPPSHYVNEAGYRDCDTPFYGWHGHLDGLWAGATAPHQDLNAPMTDEAYAKWSASPAANGQHKEHPSFGTNVANFTALVGIALSDQSEEGAGNLGVLSGAHHSMAAFFRRQRALGGPLGPDGPEWPRIDTAAPNRSGLRHYPDAVRQQFSTGAAFTADGKLWPRPTLIRVRPGDAVIAVYGLPHCATRVESDEPRLMAYFRITNSTRPAANHRVYPDALCDPWIEWPGLEANVLKKFAQV